MRCCGQPLTPSDESTLVCMLCGCEEFPLHIGGDMVVGFQNPVSSAEPTYSRKKRFSTLLDQIVLACPSQSDMQMIEYLDGVATEICDISTLIAALKGSPLRDKRYSSLHLFSKLFIPKFKSPRPPAMWLPTKHRIIDFFSHFERMFVRIFPSRTFVSYAWLLRKTLEIFEMGRFGDLVKPLKCSKRARRYMREFQSTVDGLSHEGMPPEVWGALQSCLQRPSVHGGYRIGRHVQKRPCAGAPVRRTGLSGVPINHLLKVARDSGSGGVWDGQCQLLRALGGARSPGRVLQKPAREHPLQ